MSDRSDPQAAPPAPDAAGEPRLFRSLEQLEGAPEYVEFLQREFQPDATELPADDVSRRGFLGLLGASIALAGLSGCRKPYQKILPFAKRPEGMIPGVPRWYATAQLRHGYGIGTLVKSSDGRPTKIEGNPDHPASLGGADVWMHGELLQLYDPARTRAPRQAGVETAPTEAPATHDSHRTPEPQASSWTACHEFLASHFGALQQAGGQGLAFLLEPSASPSQQALLELARRSYPSATFHVWTPLHRDRAVAGSRLAFGSAYEAQYRFDRADLVAAFDSDFLRDEPASPRYARDFAAKRKITEPGGTVARLYVAEPAWTITGGQADHRFRLPASRIQEAMLALAAELNLFGDSPLGAALAKWKSGAFTLRGRNWIEILARDLLAHRGRSLVVAGAGQPPLVHALAHAINDKLRNCGATVAYTQTPAALAEICTESIKSLATALADGRVQTLVCLGTNPAYDAPAELAAEFVRRFADPKLTLIHAGLHRDETAQLAKWHLPLAHPLESWADVRAFDGTVSIVQPLIAPLHDGTQSLLELLARLIDPAGRNESLRKQGYEIVREHWANQLAVEDFDSFWNRSLHDGLVQGSAFPVTDQPAILAEALAQAVTQAAPAPALSATNLELRFCADASLLDGRYANNAWLQELPDPISKLTWDNAAWISPDTAAALGVGDEDLIRISLGRQSLEVAVFVLPGHADFSVTLPLGYGRRLPSGHRVAAGTGFDTYVLRTLDAQAIATGASAARTGGRYPLSSTQNHGSMEGRPLYRENTLAAFRAAPEFAPAMSPLARAAQTRRERGAAEGTTERELMLSLWPERDYSQGYQWGMVVDLNSCTGCNACVVACQSENNVPVVGKAQVRRGREMHWLRVDRYFTGAGDGAAAPADPGLVQQPVPCMHCENAPCESVCPVAATTHSPEGLNDMVYNRCIGTRYCNNNCPYKVRRFNWFNFTGSYTPTEQMAMNPDVTVRARGVMEKCTYCVQRIQGAKIQAKRERRKLRRDEVTTACAQTCPSDAIVFGDVNDPQSRVSRLRASPLNYAMLAELNVKPRTTYLARIRNPNPELA